MDSPVTPRPPFRPDRRPVQGRGGASPWPAVAAGLAVILVLLVAIALVLPGPLRPAPSSTPGASPSGIAGSSSPSASPTFVRPTPSPRPTFTVYTVRSGDSLTSIARQFETTARSIAFWNRDRYPTLDPESEGYAPNTIQVGWQLAIIPGTEYEPEPQSPIPSPASPSNPASPSPSIPAVTPPPATPTTPPATAIPTGPAAVVENGSRQSNRVALTFDMGGRLDPALDIMDWLIDNQVKATIFPTGHSGTETQIGRAVLERVRDHPELFDLGNHSWDHPDFRNLTKAQMADQLTSTESAVGAIVGTTSRPWFRPPFGGWNNAVRSGVGAAGWKYLVMWDVDTIDWRPTSQNGPTAAQITDKVVTNARGGSIVLMHLGGWHTLEALPGMLDGLADRGLVPATLDELLGG